MLIDELIEKAFCDGYEYALMEQREFNIHKSISAKGANMWINTPASAFKSGVKKLKTKGNKFKSGGLTRRDYDHGIGDTVKGNRSTGTEWRKTSRNADPYNHKVDNQSRTQMIKKIMLENR